MTSSQLSGIRAFESEMSLFTLETLGGHVHLVGSFSFSRPQLENILGLSEVTIYRLTLSPE